MSIVTAQPESIRCDRANRRFSTARTSRRRSGPARRTTDDKGLRGNGGHQKLLEWWGERRCLAALGGQAAPDGYGRLQLPGQQPASFLLELDRGTEDHERLRQKARRYARALPRSPLAIEQPLVVLAVPTQARRDNLTRALATSRIPLQAIGWTPPAPVLPALARALGLALPV